MSRWFESLSGSPQVPARLPFRLAAPAALAALTFMATAGCTRDVDSPAADTSNVVRKDRVDKPRRFSSGNLTIWWDRVPESIRETSSVDPKDSQPPSNIRPADYIGPEACQSCHAQQHELWSRHPHRFMNAMAQGDNVLGDFSGTATLNYLGGKATFFEADNGFRVRLSRGNTRRIYQVNQTIGSRFFQYYVGKQLEGPEHDGHKFFRKNHVLPFGYWIDRREWVPVVHIGSELPDEKRHDPFDRPATEPPFFSQYNQECNYCHTTFPLGDMMIRQPYLIGQHAPLAINLWTPAYLQNAHPELWDGSRDPTLFPDDSLALMSQQMQQFAAAQQAVSLGISCEACHLGSREHAKNPKIRPRFFPAAPELVVESPAETNIDYGRTHTNLNWACGRCHTGKRPVYAGGLSTWNSIEYTDATLGGCYSKLRCIDCHDPHTGTGSKWERPASETDQLCLGCHAKYKPLADRQAHTHHSPESQGSRCMSCHMPRINEGLQDVVRTHTIHSPNATQPLIAKQLNACNLCHTNQTIAWTLKYLENWYDPDNSQPPLAPGKPGNPDDSRPAGTRWLRSQHESVRLVGLDALARSQAGWALPRMLDALDDPFLVNRQFATRTIESWLKLSLSDFGYRFYMTAEQRRPVIQRLRQTLVPPP